MSTLNPEAAEFRPVGDQDLETLVKEGFSQMNMASRSCHQFPSGATYSNYQTVSDFGVVVSQLHQTTLGICNNSLYPIQAVTLRCNDDDESNLEKLSEANEVVLDHVSAAMEPSVAPVVAFAPHAAAPAAWNRSPTLATVQVKTGSMSLFSAKNITRPQLSFKQPVDNSDTLFVPLIQFKPNALRPLMLTINYSLEGLPVGYEHPYKMELDQYMPPDWAMNGVDMEEREVVGEIPLTMVDTPQALNALLNHLDTVHEISVDLEHHSYRSFLGMTCLIQLSTDSGGDFIVDALALRDHLHLLNYAFTNPQKLKVFHGATNDILWLQRDFGVYVVGMFDTQQAAHMLRLPYASLKYLLKLYCNIDADKTHQLADWRMRPLPDELVEYARSDTQHLLRVWRRMRADLRAVNPDALAAAFRASQQIALITYNKPSLKEDSHLPLYVRSGKRFNPAQMAALRALWAWRDSHARELDESTGYLMPNHMLMTVAEVLPRDLPGLRALCEPTPPFLLHNLHALHQIVLSCRDTITTDPGLSTLAPLVVAGEETGVHLVPDVPDKGDTHNHSSPRLVAVQTVPDLPSLHVAPWNQRGQALATFFMAPFHLYRFYKVDYRREDGQALWPCPASVVSGPMEVVPAPGPVVPTPEPVQVVPSPEPAEDVVASVADEPAPAAPGCPPAEHVFREPSPFRQQQRANPAQYARANYSRLRTNKPQKLPRKR